MRTTAYNEDDKKPVIRILDDTTWRKGIPQIKLRHTCIPLSLFKSEKSTFNVRKSKRILNVVPHARGYAPSLQDGGDFQVTGAKGTVESTASIIII